jgi:hypothetical protein
MCMEELLTYFSCRTLKVEFTVLIFSAEVTCMQTSVCVDINTLINASHTTVLKHTSANNLFLLLSVSHATLQHKNHYHITVYAYYMFLQVCIKLLMNLLCSCPQV